MKYIHQQSQLVPNFTTDFTLDYLVKNLCEIILKVYLSRNLLIWKDNISVTYYLIIKLGSVYILKQNSVFLLAIIFQFIALGHFLKAMLFGRNVQKTVDSPKSARFSKFKKKILIHCQDNANNTNSFGLFRMEKTCLPPY